MNEHEYRIRQTERAIELSRMDKQNLPPPMDRDIWILEHELTQIQPYSWAWRRGLVHALRRAIRALERENREKEEKT